MMIQDKLLILEEKLDKLLAEYNEIVRKRIETMLAKLES